MKKLSLFLLLSFLLVRAQTTVDSPKPSAGAARYTFLLAGNKAGFETSAAEPDGTLVFHSEFNDRGRGPKIDERIVLGKDGTPAQLENKGNDYLKAPVNEHFSINNGKAVWKSETEEGEKRLSGGAFYLSGSGTTLETGVLARALLAAPGHRLALLPEGEATIEKLNSLKVQANGQSRTVIQYSIGGLGFAPSSIWLNEDGSLFAVSFSWIAVVAEGWESTVDVLNKAQDQLQSQRAGNLAKKLAHKPAQPLVFEHANLFDADAAAMRSGSTVVISGNKITAVGRDGQVNIPPNAEIIDAAGKTLMPGLWDMHVHLSREDGLLNMAAGVTSVRDLANDIDFLTATKKRFDEGAEIGPRILMAGFLDGRGPYQGPTKVFADTEEEAKADIDRYASLGYVQIKIYSSIKPELVPKIAQMAHSHGMRVSGHVPAGMIARQFVLDGADEIQHMNFIFLNFMPSVKDTNTRTRLTEVAAHGAEIHPESNESKEFIQFLKEHKTVVDPTLGVFESSYVDRPGVMAVGITAVADRLPAQIRRGFLGGGLPVDKGLDQGYRDSFQQMLKMTKALYDAEVPIVAGTDGLAGFYLHRELELYVQAGIPAPRVLQLATLGAARVMKRDHELGSIAPGKLADVILIDGDPALHISDVRKVQTVVKDGVVYQSADLDRALGVKPLY
ncbi:MAG TPA: amidohydrolase family protein [Candidatus Angelobacter sp.]